jgi:hypothetical protein
MWIDTVQEKGVLDRSCGVDQRYFVTHGVHMIFVAGVSAGAFPGDLRYDLPLSSRVPTEGDRQCR